MNSNILDQTDKESVVRRQAELDAIRLRLNINDRDTVLFRAELSDGDDVAIVEADGFGGATLLIIEGNYPVDFVTREERTFSTETEALIAAEAYL